MNKRFLTRIFQYSVTLLVSVLVTWLTGFWGRGYYGPGVYTIYGFPFAWKEIDCAFCTLGPLPLRLNLLGLILDVISYFAVGLSLLVGFQKYHSWKALSFSSHRNLNLTEARLHTAEFC